MAVRMLSGHCHKKAACRAFAAVDCEAGHGEIMIKHRVTMSARARQNGVTRESG